METDNKYDQSFKKAELEKKDIDWDLEAKQSRMDEEQQRSRDMEDYFTKERNY